MEGDEKGILKITFCGNSDLTHNTRGKVYPYGSYRVKVFPIQGFIHVYASHMGVIYICMFRHSE